jgi:hypothetical protein
LSGNLPSDGIEASDRIGPVVHESRRMVCAEILTKGQEARTGGAAQPDHHRRNEVRYIEHA